jgi:hypothetical protein
MIPVESTPGVRGGWDEGKWWGGEVMHDIFDIL